MITEKEKIAVQIIYDDYKKDKSSHKLYVNTKELIEKSCGKLSLQDLEALILHDKSQYISFLDPIGTRVKLSSAGISYMEGKTKRIINDIAFWIFGAASVIAAVYAVLAYNHE